MEQLVPVLVGFGPIAFGTVVLVIVWRLIVKPELDARKLDMAAAQQQLEALRQLNDQVRITASQCDANTRSLTVLVEAQRELLTDMRQVIAEARATRAA